MRAGAAFALAADPRAPVRDPRDEHGKPGPTTEQGLAALDVADAFRPWREAYAIALRELRRPA